MKYILEVEPYSSFWGNCITNMFLTILLKKDPSYEPLIYLNGYEYSSKNMFHLDYTAEYYDYFKNNLFVFELCHFTDKNNFLNEFKEILLSNPYVTLNVDLFYWNSEGAYYNKVHRSHFSFVIGFDDEERVFYVLEEDVNLNYGVRKISFDNAVQAVKSERKNTPEDYRIIRYKYRILYPYKLDIRQIIANAENLVNILDSFIEKQIIIDSTVLLNDVSNVDFYRNEYGKIAYRLKGNILLFEKLASSEMLDKQLSEQLILSVTDISNKWKLVQNIFYKYCITGRISEIYKVNKRILDLFVKEKELWNSLLHLNN
jgi:hypothetical protein